ncbi:6-hydroxymethylpterin diphosphokinase MptE-like protein [Pseudovibrio sp. SCP19]|uniref:6-hydroxymethylpterin diphosphokinase MptE-like protein n=1 Tax=Pseudovibrio sp. SCP19 TaxID=3141374 RepID=UPI003336656F
MPSLPTKIYHYFLEAYRTRLLEKREWRHERKFIWNYLYELKRKQIRPVENYTETDNSILHNLHRGNRCVIVGSAPSINDLPLERISEDYIFLLNNTYLIKDRFGKIPDAWVLGDPAAYNDYAKHYDPSTFRDVFLSSNIPADWTGDNIHRYSYFQFPAIYDGFCQFDLTKPLYQAHTVALFACQIAVAMGFKEIVLIGIDLSFSPEQPHFYQSSSRERDWARTISIQRREKMLSGFKIFAELAKEQGVKIVNASPMKGIQDVENRDFATFFQ